MTKELDMWVKDKDHQTQLLDEEKRMSEVEVRATCLCRVRSRAHLCERKTARARARARARMLCACVRWRSALQPAFVVR